MNYLETLQAVDTIKALSILGIEGGQQGAYVRYRCHKCGQNAVIKEERNSYRLSKFLHASGRKSHQN